jgi:hypothetical protein
MGADKQMEDLLQSGLAELDQKIDEVNEITERTQKIANMSIGDPEPLASEANGEAPKPDVERTHAVTEENRREIQIPGGTVRLTEDAWKEQAPTPEMQERVRQDLDHRNAIAENEAKLRAEHEARDREARFAKALERHVEDRRQYHALRGVPEAVFETDLRPEIERKFVAGEKDDIEVERERRTSSVY